MDKEFKFTDAAEEKARRRAARIRIPKATHIGEVTCGEGSYKAARNDIADDVEETMDREAADAADRGDAT